MKKITLLFTLMFGSALMFGQVVLSEDFESGLTLPAGWTNNDIAAGGEIWTFATGGDAVGYNSPNTIYYDDAFLVGNYAILDSDGYGGAIAEEVALESPAFDVSGATNVILSFNHFFTAGYGGEGYVEVYNGTAWVQVAYYTGASQDDSSFGLEEIDVSTELSSVANAQVRFRWVGDYSWGWAVDNIVVSAPTCVDPSITFDDFSQTTVDISMNASGDYDIEWGVYPYIQGTGGSTATVTAGDTYQLTSLMSGVSYSIFVRKNCGGGDYSNYIEVTAGTSPSNLSTYPYSEDLEADANQALLLNFGLSFAGTGAWSYTVDDLLDGDTTNDYAYDGLASMFSNNTSTAEDADAWVYVGPFNLASDSEYTFSFFQRVLAAAGLSRPNKDLEIAVSSTNDGLGNTILLTLDDLVNIDYVERSVTFTPGTTGEFYFGIHDKSSFLATATAGNALFVDGFSVTSEALSIAEFESNRFTHFYNKNAQTLNLESSNMEMTSIEVYSLLGQRVISNSLSNTTESIDVSALNTGVYLAKINIDGNSKTIKFIKN
ncbi:T9SS type A sorting domain-containing protein [Winogradskyella sp. Asnod2-B02-A]|uniref:T9SS type A sorting domain-containing protein n=1 Tax=Winogradskyella sp. Asnod2-B02-A TaxID=3160583 RepID=UPI003869EE6E